MDATKTELSLSHSLIAVHWRVDLRSIPGSDASQFPTTSVLKKQFNCLYKTCEKEKKNTEKCVPNCAEHGRSFFI